MPNVSYDSRALTIDGRRQLILSGAIHYPRSTPAMWPELMKRSKDAGLNTIETYVFWNLHERRRGVYDFSGRLDVRRFCEVAARHGLHVILRIGPYICAEINYGGFPAWLRDVPGIRFRTFNEPFMREMEKWVRLYADTMKGLFAPEGGPIILAQIENEYGLIMKRYGADGGKYAQWAIDLGLSLNLGVPWIMCVGGAPGAIETINGFHAHPHVAEHFAKHPDQPALWTENWPGWYDVWGAAHRTRDAAEIAWAVARFVAEGGTGVNYYMWHGGTNFGREAMFLQTTTYDYDAPLDEFGLPTTKSKALARLHEVLKRHADAIVGSDRPTPVRLGENQSISAFGAGERSLAFLSNDDPKAAARIEFEGAAYDVPPRSVTLVSRGRALLNTADIPRACVVRRAFRPAGARLSRFVTWAEPMPAKRSAEAGRVVAAKLVEQLLLTRDESDYCWYSTSFNVARSAARDGELRFTAAGDFFHVFVDGRLAARSPVPAEERNAESFVQRFRLALRPGRHELAVLSCALGLIKGDWSIGNANMADEKKGLWGPALWEGREIPGPWTMAPRLVGESARLFAEGAPAVKWTRATKALAARPLRWFRATFDRPKIDAPLAVDLAGMTKGLAWLNGRCLGRYWLAPGVALPRGWHRDVIAAARVGEPTQRYYHLPKDWLDEHNILTLFEEAGGNVSGVRVCAWR